VGRPGNTRGARCDACVREIRAVRFGRGDEGLDRGACEDREIGREDEHERIRIESVQSRPQTLRHRRAVRPNVVRAGKCRARERDVRCDHDDASDARRRTERRDRARYERAATDRYERFVRRTGCERGHRIERAARENDRNERRSV
jgi:hypothetical protein